MVELVGVGVDTDALASICTDAGHCIATSKELGAVYGRIGTCGGRTIITNHVGGSGEGIAVSVTISTDCASCDVGMVLVGERSEPIGN